jgi:hypothetical protein
MGQAAPGIRRAFVNRTAHASTEASAIRVYEPEIDMDRRVVADGVTSPGTGRWYRRVAAALSLARPDAIIERPRRATDRDHQDFPFAID